jgi:Flp pilus assembly protein TadD/DNA-binding CsgD family transcriptional regulator
MAYFRSKNYEAAQSALKDAVSERETSAPARYYLGSIARQENRIDDAVRELEQALRIKPDYPDALAELGQCRLLERDYAKAENLFRRALELDPESAEAHIHLGAALHQRGERAGAEAAFRRAAALAPDSFSAHFNLGTALRSLGNLAGAEAAFRRAAERLGEAAWLRCLYARLVAEAAIADRWGDPVGWLRQALPVLESAGHDRVVAACKALLRKAGAPLPRRGRGGSEVPLDLRSLGVTSREMDVLRLVADGLPNRGIAARLYLSPRTVETHLASLQRRTGATSRAELAELALAVLARERRH